MAYITTTYNGREYSVPETGPNEDGTIFDSIPEREDGSTDWDYAFAFLRQDGDLACFSSWGDTYECAPVAVLLERIMQHANGEPVTYYSLNGAMSQVVNDADGVAYTIADYAAVLGEDPDAWLDEQHRADADAYRAMAYGE